MNRADLEEEITRYSKANKYLATEFNSLACNCGRDLFCLYSDETGGGALASCCDCGKKISIYDSAEYMEDTVQNVCRCGHEALHLTVGAALYEGTKDPRWIYVGAKCPKCNLVGVYVDWNER